MYLLDRRVAKIHLFVDASCPVNTQWRATLCSKSPLLGRSTEKCRQVDGVDLSHQSQGGARQGIHCRLEKRIQGTNEDEALMLLRGYHHPQLLGALEVEVLDHFTELRYQRGPALPARPTRPPVKQGK